MKKSYNYFLSPLLILFVLVYSCSSVKNTDDYTFIYRFKLDHDVIKPTTKSDSAMNDIDKLNTDNAVPTWYNIHSKQKLTPREVNIIKQCAATSYQSVTDCRKEGPYYLTIEI